MTNHDLIVVGTSAGGVESLRAMVADLPRDLPAAVVVVMHVPSSGSSALPQILARTSALPVLAADDDRPIEPGTVYVAPPGTHVLVKPGRLRLVPGPKENGVQPAIDPLFRSAAAAFGPRVIGVILSGTLDDGTEGLRRIHDRGGLTVVLDPAEALFPGMPMSAIENVEVHHVVGLAEMGATLARLAREPAPPATAEVGRPMDDPAELDIVEVDAPIGMKDLAGEPSGFTCPECGGALWEVVDGGLARYRCRVGHAYSPESLLSEQDDAMEAALWAGIRALDESASLRTRLAGRARRRGDELSSARFAGQARLARERSAVLRAALGGRVVAPEEAGLPVDPGTGEPSPESEAGEQADVRI